MIVDAFDAPTAEEYSLIYDSWARSFRKSPWAGCVPNHLWDGVSRACIAELLNRSLIVVAVKQLENGTRRVMGYSVSEPGVLHWLYVKDDFRGMGVGKALLQAVTHGWEQHVYTHRTRASDKFLHRASGTSWIWDPVLARVRK
jgi:ribosomal protein S18 acetylase RimI-like enzyme